MKFTIASDLPQANSLPCRLRLKSVGRLSEAQAAHVAGVMSALPFVNHASASSATGSVVLTFGQSSRQQVLNALADLDLSRAPENFSPDFGLAFRKALYGKVFRHFAKKLLPAWFRDISCVFNAIRFVRKAIASLASGKVGVEVLDGTAIVASIAMGDRTAASSLMFLLGISELMEDYTRARARRALADSLELNLDTVWVLSEDGTAVPVPASQLKAGDSVIVRAGSAIPADGTVLSGEATVNQASLTGEPNAVFKKTGDSVFAGTAIEEGELTINARSVAGESRVARIVKMIDESESLKAQVQSSAERLADRIVPFNFALAAAAYVFGGARAALSALLVDYSCAIKISAPMAVMSAMREASSLGMIVKGGKYLEAAMAADTVVFDKTGTLTSASPEVIHVGSFCDRDPREILRTAACIEEHFPHPLARAVIHKALQEGLSHAEEHAEVKYIAAHGIATSYAGRRVVIGSRHFVEDDEGVGISPQQFAEMEANSQGGSILYLAEDGRLAGYLCISDPPRPEARETISRLRELGVKRVIMLTGDGDNAARASAQALGIDEYRSQMLPEDKRSFIEELKASGRKVLMVGDGINDSPALAAADVSVSMSGCSDLASQTADVTLLPFGSPGDELGRLVTLRLIGQRLMDRIDGNYRTIVGVNSTLLALGLSGVLSASTLSFAHNATTAAISAASTRKLLE